PLDAAISPSLKFPESNIPGSARGIKGAYTAFAPPKLRAEIKDLTDKGQQLPRAVRVSVVFGTGSELGRHGLRAFVDKGSWRMIVNVPGVEPSYPFASGQRWGIGLNTDYVEALVRACFGRHVDFVVDRLVGFSTGYIGVTGTIRNELLDLRNVDVLAFLD